MKEATARIKINKLLEAAGWRFFPESNAPANIRLEPSVTIKPADLDALGENFERAEKGFVDFLLLDARGFPLIVLEAKAEDKNPLVGKEQARKYARSQNCRFVILSSGNLHYFWDLERGNPYLITSFPTPDSVIGYQKVTPNPERLIAEQVGDDYIVLTQRPSYQAEAGWKNEGERPGYIQANKLRFLRPYLPYRDPETLRAFLKIIDEFTYDHSERLGDAFEYLLSVLGSQGDAGQFRTPRHIIDFIVAIIDPKKTDIVLDPACGTAGFLISSYKHILQQNTSPRPLAGEGPAFHSPLPLGEGPGVRAGDLLTPDDKGRLAQNFKGYDISPDMVRLSLVNLYLHGFADPHIYEYDTLTSQDRWNEYADVILANPPFMSPKGGIKPHNRFSVQSKRSEVLFVDYMAEHLTPQGRAGIIVPEGIIFQSQTAYTQLRKMLVEEYLVAVVSMPAGMFNPYSGVKTSILILDKSLAKKANTIAFFKIANDGFGLGAQRRAIEKNDLPQVQAELAEYLRRLRSGEYSPPPLAGEGPGERETSFQPTCGLIVAKDKIAANGDYNLSGERYRKEAAPLSAYPHVALNEVCEINPEAVDPAELHPGASFNYIDISCVENESGKFLGANTVATADAPSRARRLVKQDDVLISTVRPNLKAFTILSDVPERAIASTGFAVLRSKAERVLPGFLIAMLRHEKSVDQMVGMMGKGALHRKRTCSGISRSRRQACIRWCSRWSGGVSSGACLDRRAASP